MLTAIVTAACGRPAAERAAAPSAGPTAAPEEPRTPALSAPPPQPLTFRRAEDKRVTHLQVEPGGLDLGLIEFNHVLNGEIDLCGEVPGFELRDRRPVLVQKHAPGKAPVTIVEVNRPNYTRSIIFVTNEARPRVVLELSLPQLDPNSTARGGWELVKPVEPGAPLEARVSITDLGCRTPDDEPCREETTHRPRGIDCR